MSDIQREKVVGVHPIIGEVSLFSSLPQNGDASFILVTKPPLSAQAITRIVSSSMGASIPGLLLVSVLVGALAGLVLLALLLLVRHFMLRLRPIQNVSEACLAWHRLVAEQSTDLVLLTDDHHSIHAASPSFQSVLGYDHRQAVGQMVLEQVHPDDVAETRTLLLRVREQGTGHAVFRLRHADGRWRWIEATGAHVCERGTAAILIVGRDITDRKQLEAELLQAQKLATIGRVSSHLFHDVNNMLMGIASFAELARHTLPPAHPAYGDLDEIIKATGRATSLSRSVLGYTRTQIAAEPLLNLNDLISGMKRLLQAMLGPGILLTTQRDPDLACVNADRGQIEQVIVNLAVNARDAMPNGGVLTIATANITREDHAKYKRADCTVHDYVLLTLQDTGAGMDSATRARLFEPFFTTKSPERGTGLGLSTCKTILARYRGDISITSELGIGTTVKLYLPQATQGRRETKASPDLVAPGQHS